MMPSNHPILCGPFLHLPSTFPAQGLFQRVSSSHQVAKVLDLQLQLGLPFPSPVDHVFSELSTVTCPSWVALHGMAHNFLELHKTVIHVIILISFL